MNMYKHFIQGVDAIDNGVEQYKATVKPVVNAKRRKTEGEGGEGNEQEQEEEDSEEAPEVTLEKVYLEETGLSNRVGALNAAWNEDASNEVQDARFQKASDMAGSEFLSKLNYLHKSWLPARDIVKKAIMEREQVSLQEQFHSIKGYG